MKRYAAALLCLLMLFSLTACKQDPLPGTESSQPSTETTQVSTIPTESTEPTAVDSVILPQPQYEPSDITGILGTIQGSVYTNKPYNLSYTLPEGWRFYTQEEIDSANGLTEGHLDGVLADQMLSLDQRPLIMGATNDQGMSVTLRLYYETRAMSLMDLVSGGLWEMRAKLEESGATVHSVTHGFLGSPHLTGFFTEMEKDGQELRQEIYPMKPMFEQWDHYMGILIVSVPLDQDFRIADGGLGDLTDYGATMGHQDGNTYTNQEMGLIFEAPKDWTFSNNRQLLEMFLEKDRYYGDPFPEDQELNGVVLETAIARGSTSVPVMYATDGKNASVTISIDEESYFDRHDTNDINDTAVNSVDLYLYTYDRVGEDVVFLGTKICLFLESCKLAVYQETEQDGQTLYQYTFYQRAKSSWLTATITITASSRAELDAITEAFVLAK